MHTLASVLLFVLVPTIVAAQEKKAGDIMIEKYLAAETDKLSAKFLDGAKTIDEWKQKPPRLNQEYMDMLGLWSITREDDTPGDQDGRSQGAWRDRRERALPIKAGLVRHRKRVSAQGERGTAQGQERRKLVSPNPYYTIYYL